MEGDIPLKEDQHSTRVDPFPHHFRLTRKVRDITIRPKDTRHSKDDDETTLDCEINKPAPTKKVTKPTETSRLFTIPEDQPVERI